MIRRNFLKTGLAGIGALAVPGTIQALNSSILSSGKKWAVLYGSQCGSTKEYSNCINEGLGGIADVVDIATTTPKVIDYEYFVIGGWRSGGTVQPTKITDFIKNNKSALKEKIKGLFVVLGNGGDPTLAPALTTFLTSTLVTPSGVSNKPAKVLFGRSVDSCNHLGLNYDNVKKEEGVAFGKQIIDAATATILDGSETSQRFALSYKVNPLTSVATISYSLPGNTTVRLTANALNGRQVATLVSTRQEAGSHNIRWNTGMLAPGVYLYRLEAAGHVETRIATVAGY